MKYIVAVIVSFCCFGEAWSFEIIPSTGGVVFAKYKYKGTVLSSAALIETESEMEELSTVKVSTGDFENVYPTANEVALATTAFNATTSKADIQLVFADKTELKAQILKYAELLATVEKAESVTGVLYPAEKSKFYSILEFMRRQYLTLP